MVTTEVFSLLELFSLISIVEFVTLDLAFFEKEMDLRQAFADDTA